MKSYIKFSRINSDLLIINEPAVIYKNERYKGKSFITVDSFISELLFKISSSFIRLVFRLDIVFLVLSLFILIYKIKYK